MTDTEDKPHVSANQLKTFLLCPWQYHLIYQKGLRKAPGFALHVGSATHDAAAIDLTHKVANGSLLELGAVQAAAADSVNTRWDQESAWLTEDERQKGEKVVRGEAVDQAVQLATLHHEAFAPIIQPAPLPLGIEWEWTLSMRGYDCDLTGRTDVNEIDNTVRELKTRSSKPPDGLADRNDQLTIYALARKTIHGVNPPLAMDFLVKTKKPATYTQRTYRDQTDFNIVTRKFAAMLRAIEKDVFFPCPEDSWKCAPKWCGFYMDDCKWVNSKRRPLN